MSWSEWFSEKFHWVAALVAEHPIWATAILLVLAALVIL